MTMADFLIELGKELGDGLRLLTAWLRSFNVYDWLRVLGYSILSVVIALGFLGLTWLGWARYKLRQYRLSDSRITNIQDSQRGRRPLWLRDREQNDQSRVDREC